MWLNATSFLLHGHFTLVSRPGCTRWVPKSCWPHPQMVTADWSPLAWVQVVSPIPYSLGAGWVPKAVQVGSQQDLRSNFLVILPTGDPTCTDLETQPAHRYTDKCCSISCHICGCGQQLPGTQWVQPSLLTRGVIPSCPMHYIRLLILKPKRDLNSNFPFSNWHFALGPFDP